MKRYAIIAQIAALMCTLGSMARSGLTVLNVTSGLLLAVSLFLNIREEVI